LTRLQIVVSDDMPETCSGLTAWTGKEWLISLNGHEPELRRRFSLFHEAAHIVHHTTGEALYPTQRGRAGLLRELLADHFAGSVLVPKPWLKSLYCSGHIDIAELSDLFLVSRRAIEVRLHVYGLRELPPLSERRARPFATNWTPTYLRVFPAPVGVAA
jgi:Zn-dependent peptidase ImmA (M78 family)